MAKMSDKLLQPENKVTRARQNCEWIQRELDELPDLEQQRVQRKYNARLAKSERDPKFVKAALDACDKGEYARFVSDEKMQRYDVKHFWDRRAAYHKAFKKIFRSVNEQRDYASAIDEMFAQLRKLDDKRAQYQAKLRQAEQKFAERHGVTDPSAYNALSEQTRSEAAKYLEQLQAKSAVRIAKRTERLQKSLAKSKAKEQKYREMISAENVRLPQDVLLRVTDLKMYFGGLKAVDGLTFDVKKGEIFGLIGPNGAGKTTVFNCITRFYNATGGDLYFVNKQGETVNLRRFKVHDVILQGISRTFQNVELIREISVLDNLLVACTREYRSNLFVQALGLPILKKEERMLRQRAMSVLRFMDLENYANYLAAGLPYGILKKIEIARALMSNAKLIIMDEPAAGLNDSETAELTETIRRIRDEFGATILLVEHDMSLVMNVCDTVCAISFGKMLAIGTRDEIKRNKAVQEAYLGVDEASAQEQPQSKEGEDE